MSQQPQPQFWCNPALFAQPLTAVSAHQHQPQQQAYYSPAPPSANNNHHHNTNNNNNPSSFIPPDTLVHGSALAAVPGLKLYRYSDMDTAAIEAAPRPPPLTAEQQQLSLYLGHIRYETTPAELQWILREVAGVQLAKPAETRGKGGFGIFVKSPADMETVRGLHKRLLFDHAGVWVAPPLPPKKNENTDGDDDDDLAAEELQEYASGLQYMKRSTGEFRLPRDCMTVEESKNRPPTGNNRSVAAAGVVASADGLPSHASSASQAAAASLLSASGVKPSSSAPPQSYHAQDPSVLDSNLMRLQIEKLAQQQQLMQALMYAAATMGTVVAPPAAHQQQQQQQQLNNSSRLAAPSSSPVANPMMSLSVTSLPQVNIAPATPNTNSIPNLSIGLCSSSPVPSLNSSLAPPPTSSRSQQQQQHGSLAPLIDVQVVEQDDPAEQHINNDTPTATVDSVESIECNRQRVDIGGDRYRFEPYAAHQTLATTASSFDSLSCGHHAALNSEEPAATVVSEEMPVVAQMLSHSEVLAAAAKAKAREAALRQAFNGAGLRASATF